MLNEGDFEAAGAGGVIAMVLGWMLKQLGGEWRKSRAEAKKIEADTDLSLAGGWQAMAAQIRRDMEAEQVRCEARIAALEAEVRDLRAVIVGLARNRRLPANLRELLQTVAPNPAGYDEEHRP